MAKKVYIGVDGVAKKVKKIYCGVDGIAKKVKKGYIGIGGIARPFWTGGELDYYGTATALKQKRHSLAATTIGDYALFGGGTTGGLDYSDVDVYNSNLVWSTATDLSTIAYDLSATNVGNYALFAGGVEYTSDSDGSAAHPGNVTAYKNNLVRSVPSQGFTNGRRPAATHVGNYALFAGGKVSNSYKALVTVFDSNLTMS